MKVFERWLAMAGVLMATGFAPLAGGQAMQPYSGCGFSAQYPAGWQASTQNVEGQCIMVLGNGVTQFNLSIHSEQETVDSALGDSEQQMVQGMTGAGWTLQGTSRDVTIMGGLNGKSSTMNFARQGYRPAVAWAGAFPVLGTQMFMMNFVTPAASEWDTFTVRKQIAETVRFNSQGTRGSSASAPAGRLVGAWETDYTLYQSSMQDMVLPKRSYTATILFYDNGVYRYRVSQSSGEAWNFSVEGRYRLSNTPQGQALVTLMPESVGEIPRLELQRLQYEGLPGAATEDFDLTYRGATGIELELHHGPGDRSSHNAIRFHRTQ